MLAKLGLGNRDSRRKARDRIVSKGLSRNAMIERLVLLDNNANWARGRTYCRKVSKSEDAQQTSLAACTVTYDDKLSIVPLMSAEAASSRQGLV